MKNLLINFKTNGNAQQGYLSFFESNKDIPFEIKRIYYIFDVPIESKRGMHTHKKLQQVLWCPNGEVEVLLDDGKEKKSYLLDSPEKALLVLRGYWHDMYWKKEGSVLCVAASDYYNEEDYIRDYDEFLKYVKEGYWNDEN
ncbi:sugar 3,4-ketoisomerase [Alkalibacter mobilis]|uniref:sugar 3,4-ketoisomerase n=1 Tax=Alkalibacter mobilis TaxID=2787712 RepID=UPI00189DF8B5|nr:FdtA/QdtA family cupin domain-containing protein [Alkalibacter mobilis]MBF7097819.1 FdtA/QdtA family cupin domain-containing protein [Alkalibacter mobilis]